MTTRGEKVCQFIERFCLIPEGSKVGQPIKLLDFQRKFVLDVYDNPAGTSRAYLVVQLIWLPNRLQEVEYDGGPCRASPAALMLAHAAWLR